MLHAMTQKSRKEIDSCSDPFGNVRHSCPIVCVWESSFTHVLQLLLALFPWYSVNIFSLLSACVFDAARQPCLRLLTLSVAGLLKLISDSISVAGWLIYIRCLCFACVIFRVLQQVQAHSLFSFMILRRHTSYKNSYGPRLLNQFFEAMCSDVSLKHLAAQTVAHQWAASSL